MAQSFFLCVLCVFARNILLSLAKTPRAQRKAKNKVNDFSAGLASLREFFFNLSQRRRERREKQ